MQEGVVPMVILIWKQVAIMQFLQGPYFIFSLHPWSQVPFFSPTDNRSLVYNTQNVIWVAYDSGQIAFSWDWLNAL